MKLLVTLELDLSRAKPSLIKEMQWDDLSDFELGEAVADYFGDIGAETLLKDQFLECFEGVGKVERVK